MARTRTLKIGAVSERPLDQQERHSLAVEAERALHPINVASIPVERIVETPEARNSRRGYDEEKLNELAASIREHGVLQPILVTPDGSQYRVIAGNRRLKASIRAGQATIPALIKTQVDEHRQFFLNLVENVQRVDLTGKERVEAIRLLAASGLGVRQISRGTGISPGTISRWLRIADRPVLAQALEEERLDIARAMALAPVKDEAVLARLVDEAPRTPRAELMAAVQTVLQRNTYCVDDGRLADVDRKLALVRTVTDVGAAHLLRIKARVEDLLALLDAPPASPAAEANGNQHGHRPAAEAGDAAAPA
ncbi:MAG: ParB/RepB/Spo0J family partition protein [Chloroflexi bacterium]|nr:ParB/RepB/Spo0J family partition protein [Chloroflexota bacterium]